MSPWTLIALNVGHVFATVVWIGGMFFAHMILRPAAQTALDPVGRLKLMKRVFGSFFVWVWLSILLLWGTGYGILFGLYAGKPGTHVHAMMGIAGIMTLIFALIYFLPYRRFSKAVTGSDWPAAGAALKPLRALILANLILGLINLVIGAAGPGLFG